MVQNGVVKVGERLLPTIRSNAGEGSRAMALALAFILRYPSKSRLLGSFEARETNENCRPSQAIMIWR